MISEFKNWIPNNVLNMPNSEPDQIIKEFIFTKIQTRIPEYEILQNEQIHHWNIVPQMFLEFDFLRLQNNEHNSKITEFEPFGFLKRTSKNKQIRKN